MSTSSSDDRGENYWELLTEVGRLQSELGADLEAWAQAYEAGGRALQRSGRTLEEMARQGQRLERHLIEGPPAVVSQLLRMFTGPWPGMGMPPGATLGEPFAAFWDVPTSSRRQAHRHAPSAGEQTTSDDPG
jgi:hypothetical protein